MPKIEDYNKGLIYTDIKGCIDCNKCIHECPILKSNVSVMDSDGKYKMCVDDKECILCGTCIDTCVHDVRHYKDDCAKFFADLEKGVDLSLIIAPSFYLNYPNEYKHILGYLKSLGVKNFYPVSFGADIAIWAYLSYLTSNSNAGYISQPCPSIVSNIEKHLPELLPKLIPIQSPMMCTAIYLKKYKRIKENLAFLSPCIAKKIEIESKRGLGLVSYNVTFKNLMEYIGAKDVSLDTFPAVSEELDYGMGSIFPKPGGLKENIEYYLGNEAIITQVEGESKAYEYLKSFAEYAKEHEDYMPDLVDVLNCERGCMQGTGTDFRHINSHKINYQSMMMRKKKYQAMTDGNQNILLDPRHRRKHLNEAFRDLKLEDFICVYENDEDTYNEAYTVTHQAINKILIEELNKFTEDDRRIDCSACGYKTCSDMAEAIALGINHRDNCVYYVKDSLVKSMGEVRNIEERLRTIIDNMPLVWNLSNRNFEIIECNEEAVKLFDLRDRQEHKERYRELFPLCQPGGERSIERAKTLIAQALEIGQLRLEWMFQKLNGEKMPCEVTLIRVKWHGEDHVLTFLRDLREFYKNQENVLLMEQRMKAMLNASPILCAIFDENFNITEVNEEAAKILKLSDKQEYVDRFFDLCPEYQPDGMSSRQKSQDMVKRALQTGKEYLPEWIHQSYDGEAIPVEVHLERVRLADKDAVLVYARDLREQKDMFAKLESAIEREQSASNAKSKFLSNMSHEIRTPMNAIIGLANIAQNAVDFARKDDCINKIEMASNHLLGIVNQILDMTKIEADKLELYAHLFNFKNMISGVTSVFSTLFEEKELNFVESIDENVPLQIITDDTRLAQVITNLLSNAIKFTPEGGTISLRIQLLLGEDTINMLRIEVADTGIGVSPEKQAHVFDSFEQAEADTTRYYGGTGLGLAISKRIVELLGGSIWIESELGMGSRFIFTCPFELDDTAECEGRDLDLTEQLQAIDSFEGNTVLIAEDIEINREIIIAILEPMKLNVECVENGVQALQCFSSDPGRYDIIFMDLRMPEMDGLTASRLIRELDIEKAKSIPIIAMTANAFQEDIEMCLAAGMNGHLAKPLEIDLILEELRKHLSCGASVAGL